MSDQETRQRLVAAAARLFAERGFDRVTVREICRAARANVAAVNYHFGDKLGLYRRVLQSAIDTMRPASGEAHGAGQGRGAEVRLRGYIQAYLRRIVGLTADSWILRIMNREMSDPTPSLDEVVEQVMRPRFVYLCSLVGELMQRPPTDPSVVRAAASIQSQCVAYRANPISSRLHPSFNPTPKEIEQLAEHITAFSLAGIQAVAGAPRRRVVTRESRSASSSSPARRTR